MPTAPRRRQTSATDPQALRVRRSAGPSALCPASFANRNRTLTNTQILIRCPPSQPDNSPELSGLGARHYSGVQATVNPPSLV